MRKVFAFQDCSNKKEIRIYFTDGNTDVEATTIDVFHLPSELELIGGYRALLYFKQDQPVEKPFYGVLQGNVEVKRRYLACDKTDHFAIVDDTLSCIAEIKQSKYLLVVDLNSDKILFRWPLIIFGPMNTECKILSVSITGSYD